MTCLAFRVTRVKDNVNLHTQNPGKVSMEASERHRTQCQEWVNPILQISEDSGSKAKDVSEVPN